MHAYSSRKWEIEQRGLLAIKKFKSSLGTQTLSLKNALKESMLSSKFRIKLTDQ